MKGISILLVAVAAAASASILTVLVRRYAIKRALLDVPNERSSHSTPTPRGGGLAVATVVLSGILSLTLVGALSWRIASAFLGGGALVAWIGWRDDRSHVPARIRASVHFAAAIWAVYWIGGMPTLTLGAYRITLGVPGSILAILGVAWCVNLYNFMDGIDGIAGGEALTVAAAAGALLLAAGETGLAAVAWLIAGAAAGFLWWNWSPARIFLGDVGSGFLGFMLAALAVASERAAALPALIFALMLGMFVIDATVTLLRRIAKRERFFEAHRSHAYQRAVQHGLSHQVVALIIMTANGVLGLLAWLAISRPELAVGAFGLGTALVVALYLGVEWAQPM